MNREQEIEMLKQITSIIKGRYLLCEVYEKGCTAISKWSENPSLYVLYGRQVGSSIYNRRQILSTEFTTAQDRLIDILNSDPVIRDNLSHLDVTAPTSGDFVVQCASHPSSDAGQVCRRHPDVEPLEYLRENIQCIWGELQRNVRTYCLESLINNYTMSGDYGCYNSSVGARIELNKERPMEEIKELHREYKEEKKKRKRKIVTSDEVALFLKESGYDKDELIGQRIGVLYAEYLDWCSVNPFAAESRTKFTQSIKTMYALNTKKVRKGYELDYAFCI